MIERAKKYCENFFQNKVIQGSRFYYYLALLIYSMTYFKVGRDRVYSATNILVGKKQMIVKNNIGKFKVNTTNDSLSKSTQNFEENIRKWFYKNKKRRIFLDIGANIGFYTVLAVNVLRYENIYSFEPSKKTYNLLEENIKINNLKNVNCYNLGVGSENITTYIENNKGHTGKNKINREKGQKIQINILDDILPEEKHDKVDMIKIDVEGYELKVLKGSSNILKSVEKGTIIIIEIKKNNRKEAINILKNNNFEKIEKVGEDYLFRKKT